MDVSILTEKGDCFWELAPEGDMRVPVHMYASSNLLKAMDRKVLEQARNVACLPGIVKASMTMPDAHWGYGFPIGGVGAFDPDQGGIISVGGIGYDISCGVRTMLTGLKLQEVQPVIQKLTDKMFKTIPAGVGSQGFLELNTNKLDELLMRGASWAVEHGHGWPEDLDFIEDQGVIPDADPSKVSREAKKRQRRQIGTLGSGNHYLEIQYVEEIFDHFTAEAFGLNENDVLVSLHCGSRALGHQIGTDYIQVLAGAAQKYNIQLPERELVCAPINSPEGRDYFQAMCCGINCAVANRQVLGHLVRETFAEVLPHARLNLLYDVSHNTCKIEEHQINGGKRRRLYVHRKGATRAMGPGRKELPDRYQKVGQPVIIGGTMGTSSYILAGSSSGQEQAWSSACHGAGRSLSRRQATKRWKGRGVIDYLYSQGIYVRAASQKGAAEEAPQAYKDVSEVVESTHLAGLARKVARVRPMSCIKG